MMKHQNRRKENRAYRVRELTLLCGFLLTLFLSVHAYSQGVGVKASMDQSVIKIGEQVSIELKVSYDKGTSKRILFPLVGDTLIDKVEVVNVGKVDTILLSPEESQKTNYDFIQKKTIQITSFDSGFYTLPPFVFVIDKDTVKTETLFLQVKAVKVDTTKQFHDIKKPFEVPFNKWRKYLPYVIGGFVAAVIISLTIVYFIRRSRRKPVEVIPPPPLIPPHIKALEALRNLDQQKLWQAGYEKEYFTKLTDILRLYLGERYGINALEQTSDEILTITRSILPNDAVKDKLRQILILSDLVKFAKAHSSATENEMSMTNAIAFVEQTKEEDKPTEDQAAKE